MNDSKLGARRTGARWRLVQGLAGALLLAVGWSAEGCGDAGSSNGAPPAPAQVPTASPAAAPEAPRAAEPPRVVFLGDSLTAGLGLSEAEAYPALVGALLAERGLAVRVVNGGVSGDTSAGGLARVDWLLSLRPQLLFVALGANDGLRGQPTAAIEANLREIVRRARAAGAKVALGGMKMPPNYGPEYTREFEALYQRLARELDLPFLPFLLEGVAAEPKLNQADGIHPTAEGQRIVARAVADLLAPLVAEVEPAGSAAARATAAQP